MDSCKKEDNMKNEKEEARPQRTYKDTVFRMLFREKENLLSLYNAVNRTAYSDAKNLEITTLENAIYMNYKNDISFVMNFELMLYEHQSTVNPNMPLRHLIYVTKVLQGIIRNEDLYGSVLVQIPTPRFVIFYNGIEDQPEQKILKLSDAFEKKLETSELELAVTMYNINFDQNPEILNACQTLKEYAQYVSKVREYAEKMPFAEAVESAVDDCIRNGILSDFLLKNRAEAIEMSIFEYDEEKHLKNEREYAYKKGREEGKEEGREEGEQIGEQRGKQIGEQKGKIEGIRIVSFILKCSHQGDSKEETLQKLREFYSLSEEEAEIYYTETENSIITQS